MKNSSKMNSGGRCIRKWFISLRVWILFEVCIGVWVTLYECRYVCRYFLDCVDIFLACVWCVCVALCVCKGLCFYFLGTCLCQNYTVSVSVACVL